MVNIINKYYHARSAYWRAKRLLFPSPAELKFIEIMDGKVLRIDRIRSKKNGYPLAIVFSLGKTLKSEKFKRELRIGKYFVDFGNDIGRAIEIDGEEFHRDVVLEFDRDSYIYTRGWRILHIEAYKLWRNPNWVEAQVKKFLQ